MLSVKIKMSLMKPIYCISFLILLFLSCTTNGFRSIDKKHSKILDAYSLDTLYLADYLMYGTRYSRRLKPKHTEINLKADSLFGVFKKAVKNSGIPIVLKETNQNRMSNKFIRDDEMNHEVLSNDNLGYIAEVAGNSYNRLVIVPLISKSYTYGKIPEDPEWYYVCRLYLTIFVVSNNEILYSKQMDYVESITSQLSPLDFDPRDIQIAQKYWDGLFKETMREYIERVKWED